MPLIDPNPVASAGADDVQIAIDTLVAVKLHRGADIPGINMKIKALLATKAELANQALRAVEDSAENAQAIAAMNAAASRLKTEAANIGTAATALTQAAKVLTEAAALITALGPFV